MIRKKIKILSILLLGFLAVIAIAINSMRTPSINWSEPSILSKENQKSCCPSAILDDEGKIWVFWTIEENDKNYIVYKVYMNSWSPIMQLTNPRFNSYNSVALKDDSGRIWVFWTSLLDEHHKFYYSVFEDNWSEQMEIPVDNSKIFRLESVVQDKFGNILVFFSGQDFIIKIYYMIYDGTWSKPISIPHDLSLETEHQEFPFAIVDNSNNIWLFFHNENNKAGLYYRIFDGNWSESVQISSDSWDVAPSALIGKDGRIYLFWNSHGNIKLKVFRRILEKGIWSKEILITKDRFSNYSPSVIQDKSGKIWVFFHSYDDAIYLIRYITGNLVG